MIGRLTLVSLTAAVLLSACADAPAASADVTTDAVAEGTTKGSSAAASQLCEHGVPADLCTRCNPDLAAVFKEMGDWCEEHGVPESQCLECNPGLKFTAQAAPADWCKEHGLPESKCTKCNPKLVPQYVEAGDYCREHGFPESACPICNPELAKGGNSPVEVFPAPGTRVRLASAETVRDVGIQTVIARSRRFSRTLEVVGRLTFNQNRHSRLSSRGEALVVEVLVDVGDDVKKGQPLVRLASSSVGADQAQLSAARAQLDTARSKLNRETALVEKGISPLSDLEQARSGFAAAKADYDGARAALSASGAVASTDATGRYTLTAPFAGTVVARDAVAGKSAGAGQVLVEVADLATMWAQLDVPESDAGAVRAGQPVTLTSEGVPGAAREGIINRVAPSVDPHSRTVNARVEVPNPDRTLKGGTFLRARIAVAAAHEALMVPSEAIQRAEDRALVFVKKEETVYEPVAVVLGASDGLFVEVLEGLSPGAQVVTTGSFLLKTEILKDSIGAGCCETGEE